METRKLIPIAAFARYVGVPVGWLKAEAEAGRIPHLQAGSRVLVNPEAVEHVLLQRADEAGRGDGRG
jgi:hypothetical protein